MNGASGYLLYRLFQFLFGESAWIIFVGMFIVGLLL
jgi:hypothetical protein